MKASFIFTPLVSLPTNAAIVLATHIDYAPSIFPGAVPGSSLVANGSQRDVIQGKTPAKDLQRPSESIATNLLKRIRVGLNHDSTISMDYMSWIRAILAL